ncbi:DNA cytosine methyltransferase [Clostridium butyricum]|uniref:DNA cytosine methyltransferase n=1 Tax=Clostridium butyricum TaxID=1492 RepID=UPI0002CAADB6|nr:DNA cytosine methyltransferase [Clostridium butyricum]EMU52159.1 DNA-cytosine methyltransferase [Clostridium butyricum DKU-01]
MVVIDLFSGAGGLTEGFYKQGFKVIAHVEKDKWACETLKTRNCFYYLKNQNDLATYNEYLKNSGDYKTVEKSREIIFNKYPELKVKLEKEVINKAFGNPEEEEGVASIDEIIDLIEASMRYNNKSAVDVIIGGPPCQAYSIIGRSRMKEKVVEDKRNYLFKYYKEIVNRFSPKLFVFENVPGILTAKNGMIFKEIEKEFKEIGYKLMSGKSENHKENILNSKDFGVYENRKRMILIGVKDGFNMEYPDFLSNIKLVKEEQNTRNAIGDLPALLPGEGEDFKVQEYPYNDKRKLSNFQKLMRDESIGVLNHKARTLKDFDSKNYIIAIEGKMEGKQVYYCDFPDDTRNHKNTHSFLDRFKVHWWTDTPHTIVAHISKDGHYNIHPDVNQCRSLTVREAARIQSFPDNFKFEGPRTWQYVQVGNAVPPIMAEVIAKTIKKILKEKQT